MLRILLKHFIIHTTRVARKNLHITPDMEESFNSVRRFYVLVDQHFKEKKQVQDYADMLCKSPKTLSHLYVIQFTFPVESDPPEGRGGSKTAFTI